MSPQSPILLILIHREEERIRTTLAVKGLIRKILAVTILLIRVRAERITQKILPQEMMTLAGMIPVAELSLVAMKRIPGARNLRRKEAAVKWQISFRMARYPSIRISSCP